MKTVFPYNPYPQQQQLMDAILKCLKSEKIGCFESPTGTGKSMSILYASYSWLVEEEERLLSEYNQQNCTSQNIKVQEKNDDWFADLLAPKSSSSSEDTTLYMTNCAITTDFINMRKRIQNQDLIRTQQSKSKYFSFGSKKLIPETTFIQQKNLNVITNNDDDCDDNQFGLDPYDSADELEIRTKPVLPSHLIDDKEDEIEFSNSNVDTKCKPLFPKIFYCSRTHTQISQFVGEMKKSTFPNIRCVSLGSRKNMCIHEQLQGLSDIQITEECTNKQKYGNSITDSAVVASTTSTTIKVASYATKINTTNKANSCSSNSSSCSSSSNNCNSNNNNNNNNPNKKPRTASLKPSYEKCSYHTQSKERVLADVILHDVMDIEDIVQAGKQLHTCPYYATRQAIQNAQIVCLPYNMLLSDDMRESLGINLNNSVVIIDEAHNLIDTINQISSCEVSEVELEICVDAIKMYISRFKLVLNSKNLFYINLLESFISGIKKAIFGGASLKNNRGGGGVHKVNNGYNNTINTTTTTSSSTSAVENNHPYQPPPLPQQQQQQPQQQQQQPKQQQQDGDNIEIIDSNEFCFRCGLDNINFMRLLRHVDSTHLVYKLAGYRTHQMRRSREHSLAEKNIPTTSTTATSAVNSNDGDSGSGSSEGACVAALRKAVTLARALMNAQGDGQVVIHRQQQQQQLRQNSSLPPLSLLTQSASTANATNESMTYTATSAAAASATGSSNNINSNNNNSNNNCIQFVMLNPSVRFSRVVQSARSVLLLGGTLQPFAYLTSQLFPQIIQHELLRPPPPIPLPLPTYHNQQQQKYHNNSNSDNNHQQLLQWPPHHHHHHHHNSHQQPENDNSSSRIMTFACDHIVAPSSVMALAVSVGPTGRLIELTHHNKSHSSTTAEIFFSLLELSKNIPHGIVIFFTSYAYMKQLTESWESDNKMNALRQIKAVFIEPKNAVDSEKVWNTYKKQAKLLSTNANTNADIVSGKTRGEGGGGVGVSSYSSNSSSNGSNMNTGAILFCVIGGKLSEGINFSDELARGVVVVGLPYADKRDPILTMKLNYAESIKPHSADELYEAICMKAVNQSIGRAIRHINDYAVIVLLDCRYKRSKTMKLLPQWISRSTQCPDSFQQAIGCIRDFFATHGAVQ